jgi:magnesium-protoporphyrin O-methyltransferase
MTDYAERRAEIATYFDRTAAAAWARLTSDAPLGRIRASVRAGRDAMRETLLARLPMRMSGQRLLDAGCGTGALALEAARRGAEVVAIDLSPTLVRLAEERAAQQPDIAGRIRWLSGDMRSLALGDFDHLVAMDSLIHYAPQQAAEVLAELAPRVRASLLVTFVPRTPVLGLMHTAGRLFPRGNRAPALQPVKPEALLAQLGAALPGWRCVDRARIRSGFYTSEALQWQRS